VRRFASVPQAIGLTVEQYPNTMGTMLVR
jgi:hypothetical protein